MSEFQEYPKIARLSREIVITEKIDGTNAQVYIVQWTGSGCPPDGEPLAVVGEGMHLWAGSRNRWLQPGKTDNFGFAGWVKDHALELARLGPGRHFGEWWGSGIQRGYGLTNGEKRFSLFNVGRWSDPALRPACVGVVPALYGGPFDTAKVDDMLAFLIASGSQAAPGFMKPEGVVVFHRASGVLFKKTIEKDEEPKGVAR